MKIQATILFFLLGFLTWAQDIDSIPTKKIWSLEDCISYALENNITIKQAELEKKRLGSESHPIQIRQTAQFEQWRLTKLFMGIRH